MPERLDNSLKEFELKLSELPSEKRDILYKLASDYLNLLTVTSHPYLVRPVGTHSGSASGTSIVCPKCGHSVTVTLSL